MALHFYMRNKDLVDEVSGAYMKPELAAIIAPKYVSDTIEQIYRLAKQLAPKIPRNTWQNMQYFIEACQKLIHSTDDSSLKAYINKLYEHIVAEEYKQACAPLSMPSELSAEEVFYKIVRSDRVMPAHYTVDDERGRSQSFLVDYDKLDEQAEYQIASTVWNEASSRLDKEAPLTNDQYMMLVKIFEDYALAGFIIETENINSEKLQVLKALNEHHGATWPRDYQCRDLLIRPDVQQCLDFAYQTGTIQAN